MKRRIKFPLMYNLIFLNVFRKRRKGLIGLTNAILKTHYKEENILYKQTIEDKGVNLKTSELDIHYLIAERLNINIEMQKDKPNYAFEDRLVYYVSQLLYTSISKGENYQLKKCYSIGILNFNLYHDKTCIREFTLKDELGNSIRKCNIIIIELKKAKYCQDEKLKKWLELFTTKIVDEEEKDEEMKDVIEGILESNEAGEILNQIFRRNLEHALALQAEQNIKEKSLRKGIKTGIKQGEKIGNEKAYISIVEHMAQQSVPIETIASLTGISLEKVKQIVKN